jgi:uncharacterized membrane protein YfcA
LAVTDYLFGAVIIFLGGIVQGCAGFGLSLSTVPAMVIVIQPTILTPVQLLLSLVSNISILTEVGRKVAWRQVLWLAAGGICGIPLGIFLLKSLESSYIKLGIGVIVLAVTVAMLTGWTLRLPPRLAMLLPVGLLSGILGGSTSLNGPPVILYFTSQRPEKDEFRANMAAYFTAVNVVGLLMFLAAGLLTRTVLTMAAVFLLPLIAGTLVGIWAARQISERHFRSSILIVLALIGLMLIVMNISKLLG